MVRPVHSKRKLFSASKEQKENEHADGELRIRGLPEHSGLTDTTNSINIGSQKKGAQSSRCGGGGGSSGGKTMVGWAEDVTTTHHTPSRPVMPMSERQQIALLMQMSSPSPPDKAELNRSISPRTPSTPSFGRGVNKRNERGETPLHVAAIKGDTDRISQIISQGADVNATDYAGWSPLHEACNRGFYHVSKLLIDAGADVNAKGLDNDTPLHDACVNNHFKLVRLLVRCGAGVNVVNRRGKTPRDVCRSPGIVALIEAAARGHIQELGSFSGDDLPQPYRGSSCTSMSRRTPPANKSTEDKPGGGVGAGTAGGGGIVGGGGVGNGGVGGGGVGSGGTGVGVGGVGVGVRERESGGGSGGGMGGGGGVGGGGPGVGGGGGPGSPRVTLRLPNATVTRTPEKPRPHDTKPMMENSEDVYEFKCSKDEGRGEEEEDKGAPPPRTEGVTMEDKGDKRAREAEADEEEEARKKRRKEEIKEGVKGVGRGGGRPIGTSDKTVKSGGRGSCSNTIGLVAIKQSAGVGGNTNTSGSSTGGVTGERKSPLGSAANSPKPPSTKTGGESSDTEDDVKSESSSGAGPKVPPLKIVLGGGAEQEPNTRNGKSSSSRHLPYVVNTSSGEEKEGVSDTKEPGQPPKAEEHGVSNSSSSSSSSNNNSNNSSNNNNSNNNNGNNNGNNNNNNGNNNNNNNNVNNINSGNNSNNINTNSNNNSNNSNNNNNGNNNNNSNNSNGNSSSGSEKGSGTRITRSQRGGNSSSAEEGTAASTSVVKPEASSASASSSIKPEEAVRPISSTMDDAVHPRKRKIKMKAEPEAEPPPFSLVDQPMSNCYETFLNIRKQIERRRENLRPVQPKPPQGFKDYLMNRCSYVLAGNATSRLSVPIMSPPSSLSQLLKELFSDQEKERYRLRLQHLIEKEKLVLSVEQEILRVHGRAARALANQALPFSVCTFLKDEEVYNIISPEQEKDGNARSRYNGRLFLSWLQDVDDKWDKIKEFMVLRHHNEAESLHAVQRMDWEWKLKELGVCDANSRPQIDDLHVPMVHVSDDFDLLPE